MSTNVNPNPADAPVQQSGGNSALKWILIVVGVLFALPIVMVIGVIVMLAAIAAIGSSSSEEFADVQAQLEAAQYETLEQDFIPPAMPEMTTETVQ